LGLRGKKLCEGGEDCVIRNLIIPDLHKRNQSGQIRSTRLVGHVERTKAMRNAYILLRKPEGKRPLGTPGRRYEDDDIQRISKKWGVDRIHLIQERGQLVGSCEYGNEPSGSTNDVEIS
jgi:hypothetical protein